jgi:hypothetical protein
MGEEQLGRDRPAQVGELGGRDNEHVIDCDDSLNLAIANDDNPTQTVSPEQRKHLTDIGVRVDGDHRRRHHVVDPRVSSQTPGEDTANQISIGHDTNRLMAIEDSEHANA